VTPASIAAELSCLEAGPFFGEGLLYAELDLDSIVRGKFDLDVAGHYSRPDIFDLKILQR